MTVKPLYIETRIECPLDLLWAYTQQPHLHQQWDLRFSQIDYLPKHQPDAPQQFLYATQIGFGLRVSGIGESVATKTTDKGERTSALKFSSDSPLSLIRQGAGYWKYVPEANGIRFLTGYDYQTRWGRPGAVFDKFVFRPLMVWATAWSFDCLKNWLERGIQPRQAIRAQLTVWFVGLILGLVWLYQGLVPKLLYPNTGELTVLRQSGAVPGHEETVLLGVGIGELLFGFVLLFVHTRFVHWLNIAALLVLGFGALFSDAALFVQPFNPFSLNLAMIGLSVVALLHFDFIPKASNCITRPRS